MSMDLSFEDSPSAAPRKRQRLLLERELNNSIMSQGGSSQREDLATTTSSLSANPTPFSDKLGSEIVKIYAGPEKRLYTVHKKLLTSATPVFSSMFDGPFLESTEGSATFPEDSPEAWGLFIQYLYTNRLAPLILTPHRDKLEIEALQNRISLYCLAEAYGITPLQDLAIDSLAQTYRVRTRTPDVATFRYAYMNTSEKSPLRALMARWFYHLLVTREDGRPTRYTTEAMSTIATEAPDLLDDVFGIMRGQQGSVPRDIMDPSEVHPCTYHQHHINSPNPRPLPLASSMHPPALGFVDYAQVMCPNASEVSWEAEKLLKIMKETFPNGRKRSTVESLTRRLGIDRKQAMVLVDELFNARKVIWTTSEKLPGEQLLECL